MVKSHHLYHSSHSDRQSKHILKSQFVCRRVCPGGGGGGGGGGGRGGGGKGGGGGGRHSGGFRMGTLRLGLSPARLFKMLQTA